MKLIFEILDAFAMRKKRIKDHPFQYLNDIYKEQGLQFDEYGNPFVVNS